MMKAIRIRPLKRLILLVLPVSLLAGCSSIQNSSVYQSWEQQAYAAYRVALPNPNGSLPRLLRTVAVPGQQVAPQRTVMNNYYAANVATPLPPPVPQQSVQEEQYIADFYGL